LRRPSFEGLRDCNNNAGPIILASNDAPAWARPSASQ
jgi:hypothetical protein